MDDCLLQYTDKTLWLSATFGDIDVFAKGFGIENYHKIVVSSDFDFSKSPIYKVLPMISMNYKNKAANMPIMIERVIDIINHHEGERGLIHTGNFAFAKALMDTGHPRLISYDSKTKEQSLHKHSKSKDGVIIGPSLVEGLDLKDDLCRFQAFMKVPYLSLADKFISRKNDMNKKWYGWATSLQYMQGLGRPVRHAQDWAITYLLDESFANFLSSNKLPNYITNRTKYLGISNLSGQEPDNCNEDIELSIFDI
jgi:Rad3-related DNA helicase